MFQVLTKKMPIKLVEYSKLTQACELLQKFGKMDFENLLKKIRSCTGLQVRAACVMLFALVIPAATSQACATPGAFHEFQLRGQPGRSPPGLYVVSEVRSKPKNHYRNNPERHMRLPCY